MSFGSLHAIPVKLTPATADIVEEATATFLGGADAIVSPDFTGGMRIASSMRVTPSAVNSPVSSGWFQYPCMTIGPRTTICPTVPAGTSSTNPAITGGGQVALGDR